MLTFLRIPHLKYVLATICSGVSMMISAQTSNTTGINLTVDSAVEATNESVISLVVSIKNQGDQAFLGNLDVDSDPHTKRVNQGPIALKLAAGEAAFLPIKLWVDRQHAAGQSAISFRVLDLQNKIVQRATTQVHIPAKRQLRLLPLDTQILMRQIGDSIRIGTHVYNNGNQSEVVRLIASFPKLTFDKTQQNKEITLKAFSDTIVQFSKIIDREMLELEYFAVNIAALDQQNDFLANNIITVQNAAGNRRYSNPTNNGYYQNSWTDNLITLSAIDLAGSNPAYTLYGKNQLQTNKGIVSLSVDGTYWDQSGTLPLFTNTWAQFETSNKGIQVGNLQENDLDINLYGRGVKVYTTTEDQEKKFELGFVEKNYNLIGPSTWSDQGIAVFAKNKFTLSERSTLKSSLVFDRNYGIDSYLLMNNLLWNPSANWKYDFRLGNAISGASLKNYTLPYEPSIALGANIQGKAGIFSINSSNFYSSGYYPGMRKGAVSLDQRISTNLNKTLIWTGVNYYNYKPEYIDPLINYQYHSENARAEIGINFPLFPRLTLGLSPQINFESGRYNTFNTLTYQDLSYRSINMTETVNWTSKNRFHHLYLTLNQGYARNPFSVDYRFIFKTQLSWSYQGLQLSTHFQRGNFLLTEGLFNSFDASAQLQRFSFMPSYRKAFWNDRVSVQLHSIYNYDSASGNSFMLAGTTEWKAFKKTRFFVSFNQYYYHNKSYQTQNTFLQAGITQSLPNTPIEAGIKKGNIQLFCYYDRNANGVYDAGDEPAADRVVMINNASFVTQKDGTVRYRGVPHGEYHIVLRGKNWMAKEYDENLVSRNLQLSIPLQETGNLRGRFDYVYNAQLQHEVSANQSGLTVTLTNQQGKSFAFKTNDQGEYLAYLPIGTYELTIDHAQLPKNVYTEEVPRTIVVRKGESQRLEPLILKVRERKIEIKRFGSE
ncbi:hypothetical protein [Flavobacterium sp. JP2137]|uniref:COG1470 family protein n=1 Tax=Flavobacterium sp. JP2137 TaxID=3414510 RepID=UPI003D2FA5E8